MESFKEYLVIKGYASTTIESFTGNVERFIKWLDQEGIEAEQVSYNDVMAYVKHCTGKGLSKRTLNSDLNSIRHYYNHLIHSEKIRDNPASNIVIKGAKRRTLHNILSPAELETIYNNYKAEGIAGKRNKVILGLMIWQGAGATELSALEVTDLKLREGKVRLPASRRSNERELKLEAHQVIDIMDYMNETRKAILSVTGKESTKVFISIGSGTSFGNIMQRLMNTLRKQDKRIKDLDQVRASVITGWLKVHNLRRVQYMAGHRYVSSTEKFKVNDVEDLKEEINKYHPLA